MEGIKETKEMLGLVIAVGNGVGASLNDNKISIFDLRHFVNALNVSKAAVDNAKNIPKELKDLDEKEKQELVEYVKTTFDIPQDNVEIVVEKALAVAIQFGDLIGALISKK